MNSLHTPFLERVGLDFLAVYVPQNVRFTAKFSRLQAKLQRRGSTQNFGPYWPVVVKYLPRNRKNPTCILQFIGVRALDAGQILAILNEIVEVDPLALRTQRIDLCANWLGHTLYQWRLAFSIASKRRYEEWENLNRSPIRYLAGCPETFYIGQQADLMRVYDKTVEQKQKRPSNDIPHKWVRIERSLQGEGIPEELSTVGLLLRNGSSFDVFGHVSIISSIEVDPAILFELDGDLRMREQLLSALLLLQKHGKQEASRILRAANRNPKDLFARLERVLNWAATPMPTPGDLNERFRTDFCHQLFSSIQTEDIAL